MKKRKERKWLALSVVVAMICVMLAGCGGKGNGAENENGGNPPAGQESEEGESTKIKADEAAAVSEIMENPAEKIVIAVDDDTIVAGPFANSSGVRNWTVYALWGTLAYRPYIGAMLEDGGLELVMAKNITKEDDMTYDVEIYDNITDSLGNPIKASDVVFSLDKLSELGYITYVNTYYESGEVVDDYEFKIHLKSGEEGAIEQVLVNGTICNKEWYEGASDDEIQANPATTGPYKVTNFQTGSGMTLEARDYWKTNDADKSVVEYQNVKQIVVKSITEPSMRSVALENSEVDLAEINAVDLERFESNSEYHVTKYANAMNDYMIFNTSDDSVCSDVKVRQAVAYAFDSWTLLLANGHDQGELHHDVCPNATPDYVDDWDEDPYYEMNVEKAKELLKEAGYEEGELKIRILKNAPAPNGPYESLQAMLISAGIDAEINQYDRSLFLTYMQDSTMWDITIYSEQVLDFTTTYWSALFSEKNYEHGTQGFTEDAELQKLLAAACADRSEENMNAFHDYYTEQCYMIGLYNETKSIVTQSGIKSLCLVRGDIVPQATVFDSGYASVE